MQLKEKLHKTGRIYDFSKAALLACSLMLGCGGTAQAVRPEAPRAETVSPLRIRCDQFDFTASRGQEMFFGITERAGYRFRINEIAGGRVNADVSIPISITDGNALVYMMPRFDRVDFSRRNFQGVLDTVCSQVSRTRRSIEGAGRGVVTADFRTESELQAKILQAATLPLRPAPNIPNLGRIISMMLQGGAINVAMIHAARMQEGFVSSELEPELFRTVSSDGNTISLGIEGGEFRGRIFRLDRTVEFGFEILRSENYIFIPIRIGQLEAGEGRFMMLIGPDCRRRMLVRFGGETFDGEHPDCR
jgi:hypothetical protein